MKGFGTIGVKMLKTFKLKGLVVMDNEEDKLKRKEISLDDGLVINREDKYGWLIEAFIDKKHLDYFKSIETIEEIMIKVKITREENDPAFFITKIIAVNEISDTKINVLFQGKVVDQRKSRIEEMLQAIMEQGYQGESLLKRFKELI